MLILVLNCGSSSVKYQLIRAPEMLVLVRGLVEKIGQSGAVINHHVMGGKEFRQAIPMADHESAIRMGLALLTRQTSGPLSDLAEINAVGHRVVHGGEHFSMSAQVTPEVLQAINETIPLAPLHNPPNLAGITAINRLLPALPQVAVFDTAFHQTIPEFARLYGLPYALYEKHKIRRYGFHGTSHRYVTRQATELLSGRNSSRIISCHLGNGASVCAVVDGHSVDTSMGLTPNDGLLMGTRTGDIDPGALAFLAEKEKLSAADLSRLINSESGLLGISGLSPDLRTLQAAAADDHRRARLALDMFHYRVRKYIGAYAAAMGGVDAVIFTGGIGENSALSRSAICQGLEFMGLQLDEHKNRIACRQETILSTKESAATILLIPTDEELAIALETHQLLTQTN